MVLMVAGDFNNTGRIVKSAALGADIIGYSTSLLIANAAYHYENPSNMNQYPTGFANICWPPKENLKEYLLH